MSDDPILWVVVPTRGRPRAALRQAKLVLAEDVKRLTLVVVNDGGPRPPLPAHKNLRYLEIPPGEGEWGNPNTARHAGIVMSPYDAVIVEADDDDYLEPGALAAVQDAFRDAAVHVVYGDHWRANSKGKRPTNNRYCEKGDYTPGAFFQKGAVHVGVRAYRRALYDRVGGYRPEEFPAGDLGLMLRFEEKLGGLGIVHLPRPLCTHTTDATGISVALRDQQNEMSRWLRYLKLCGALMGETPRRRQPGDAFERTPEPVPEDFSDVVETVLQDITLKTPVVAVVPTYKTGETLGRCLNSLAHDDIPVVVVDDGCPNYSGDMAVGRWGATVVRLGRNCGYPHAVNVGARIALEKGANAILMLNADAEVRPGAVAAMWEDLVVYPQVAVVGNTHVRPNVGVDSQGSEWSWAESKFCHDVSPCSDPPLQRDMVTFGCALVRADAWRGLSGLDERYRKAYWEDADFCMRARVEGWEIIWTGGAATVHVKGASGAGRGPWYDANKRLFHGRWADTGLVDKFAAQRGRKIHDGKVVACTIVCNEEEFVRASLESVAPLVDEYVVVVGGTEAAFRAGMCGPIGEPLDGTVERLREWFNASPEGINILYPPGRLWRDKREMRQACIDRADRLHDGNWMLLLDADEVFTEEGLWRLSRHMHLGDIVVPGHWVVWNNLDTIGTGVWERYPQVKCLRWREGYNYRTNDNMPCDAEGRAVTTLRGLKLVDAKDDRLYVHYAWTRPLRKIAQKVRYYEERKTVREVRPSYYERVFMAWRDHPEEVEAEFGTHLFGGGGTARLPVQHPPAVQRMIDAGEIGGEGW